MDPWDEPTPIVQLNPVHIVIGEVQNVVASMRLNARWSSARARSQRSPDAGLLTNLINLRRKFENEIQDLKQADLLDVIRPFLDIVRSDKTSGPITGVALSSLYKFLQYGLVTLEYQGISQLMEEIGSAVTHCRFEGTDPETDEVVLVKILKVLLKAMQIDAGCLLTDEIVYDMVQTAFKMSIQLHLSVLLRKSAEMTVLEMVQTAFALHQSPKKLAVEKMLADRFPQAHAPTDDSPATPGKGLIPSPSSDSLISSSGTIITPPSSSPLPDAPPSPQVPREHINPLGVQFEQDEEADKPIKGIALKPFGLPVLIKLFRFLCSIINPSYQPNTDAMRFLGLGLVNSILELKATTIERTPKLLSLVQEDLCKYLMQNLHTGNVSILTMAMRVAFNLWVSLRQNLKYQMEFFFNAVFASLASTADAAETQSPSVAYEHQEITLETIVALCQEPSFVVDVYIAYDCDVHFGNLFDKLVDFLFKAASPNNGSVPLLALDGLAAILQSVSHFVQLPPVQTSAVSLAGYLDQLRKRKVLKQILFEGVEKFNSVNNTKFDPAIQFLQEKGLLPNPLTEEAMALFLRQTPGLNKKNIGEYMSINKPFNLAVIAQYSRTFQFKNKRFVDATREFFESFRFPGEAQVVERVTDIYSKDYFNREKGVFENELACYLCTFSVLMVNVNVHNPNVRPRDKLTLEKFLKQLAAQNNGKDFPKEFLIEIFESIKENELKIPEELQLDKQINNVTWKYLIQRHTNTIAQVVPSTPAWLLPFESPSDPSLRTGFYELLFESSWRQIITAMKVVYQSTYDPDLIRRINKFFLMCGTVASHFKLREALDAVIISLTELSTITSNSPSVSNQIISFEEKFGRDQRAQLATIALFTVCRKHADFITNSWSKVVDILVQVNKHKLLPALMEVEDIFHFSKVDFSPKPETSSSSSFFGLSTFWPFGGSSTPPPAAPEADDWEAPFREQTLAVLKDCKIHELITACSYANQDSVHTLLKVLMHESLPKQKKKSADHTGGDQIPSGASLVPKDDSSICLDVVSYILIANKHRAGVFWPSVHEHYERLLTSSPRATPFLDRALYNLLLVGSNFARVPELAEAVTFSLQLLTRLTPELQTFFSEKICVGISHILRRNAAHIRNPRVWELLLGMLRLGVVHTKHFKDCFDTLVFVVKPAKLIAREPTGALSSEPVANTYVTKENFQLIVDTTAAFAKHPGASQETVLEALELYQSLFSLVPMIIGFSNPAEALQSGRSADLEGHWLALFAHLTEGTRDKRVLVRHHAMTNLQKTLLAPEMQLCSSDTWLTIFDKVIFPLLVELLQPVTPDTPRDVVEETRLRAASILCKTFLHYMTKISQSSFKMLWLKVLSFIEMYMKADNSDLLAEAVAESLKNILLVMFTSGLLARPFTLSSTNESADLWELSWRTIDSFAPKLKPEFVAKFYPNEAAQPQ